MDRTPNASAPALVSEVPLSFWGGVDPDSGRVIDRHHPLAGESLAGRVLMLPGSRGSCSGSGVLLELLLNGHAPAALLFSGQEEILTLGALVGEALFDTTVPVFRVEPDAARALADGPAVRIEANAVLVAGAGGETRLPARCVLDESDRLDGLVLSAADRAMLAGEHGEACRTALRVVVRSAALQGARSLLDVSRAHIDGCVYNGPSGLAFARRLLALGARVRVPTTLNALSIDRERWREQGVRSDFAAAAGALGDAYVAMGARPSYTCAPYLLDDPPTFGEQIAWAESNAVVHANSVLGARTQKYPDFLDACIALTGRAPAAGCHLDEPRRPTLQVKVSATPGADTDTFWPLLGYHVGMLAGDAVPLVTGLESGAPSPADLKAFCAAFATTASSALCHLAGVTPEASGSALATITAADTPLPERHVGAAELLATRHMLDAGLDPESGPDSTAATARASDAPADGRGGTSPRVAAAADIDLVALGNPHFSAEECRTLARLCAGRRKRADVAVVVTMGRAEHERALESGDVAALERFGVRFVTDTCWCMLREPLVPPSTRALMTNSAKYAHYAPGLVGRRVRFGGLADCVEAASRERAPTIVSCT